MSERASEMSHESDAMPMASEGLAPCEHLEIG